MAIYNEKYQDFDSHFSGYLRQPYKNCCNNLCWQLCFRALRSISYIIFLRKPKILIQASRKTLIEFVVELIYTSCLFANIIL